ncbi:hypothetical protein Z517_07104 [Fonsecaea pedrosoi CBS 271.37]|uniref:Uncharacterized protein n=1 Tax=Fonsecaea pedrosoi CBS 271.37 TaxID=1442368 RepID=A0A0D2GI59_9EURO|nr:uncharacterized protein Z517_07104 [Fonsecaea pedrosoi CBS 271.37]KIW80488.1 hypothetical protein Z517_07104 [Fonsecaea pedrosoi CBS 271.37]
MANRRNTMAARTSTTVVVSPKKKRTKLICVVCEIGDQATERGVGHFLKLFWEELKTGHKPGPPTKK